MKKIISFFLALQIAFSPVFAGSTGLEPGVQQDPGSQLTESEIKSKNRYNELLKKRSAKKISRDERWELKKYKAGYSYEAIERRKTFYKYAGYIGSTLKWTILGLTVVGLVGTYPQEPSKVTNTVTRYRPHPSINHANIQFDKKTQVSIQKDFEEDMNDAEGIEVEFPNYTEEAKQKHESCVQRCSDEFSTKINQCIESCNDQPSDQALTCIDQCHSMGYSSIPCMKSCPDKFNDALERSLKDWGEQKDLQQEVIQLNKKLAEFTEDYQDSTDQTITRGSEQFPRPTGDIATTEDKLRTAAKKTLVKMFRVEKHIQENHQQALPTRTSNPAAMRVPNMVQAIETLPINRVTDILKKARKSVAYSSLSMARASPQIRHKQRKRLLVKIDQILKETAEYDD